MKWTKEQIEEIMDKFAQEFVEQVEAAGGKATVREASPRETPPNTIFHPTPDTRHSAE